MVAIAVDLTVIPEPFLVRIAVTDNDCWVWQSSLTRKGYASFKYRGRTHVVHRYVYEALVGPIPDGLTLDHLADRCTSKACCNPAHLEPVTSRENSLRSDHTLAGRQARQTTCGKGHEFTDANTYRAPGNPRRRGCRQCRAETQRTRVRVR